MKDSDEKRYPNKTATHGNILYFRKGQLLVTNPPQQKRKGN